MTLYASLTGAIDKGASGPRIGAFFDLDRTLIAGLLGRRRSCASWCGSGKIDAVAMAQGVAAAARFQLGGIGFSGFVAETVGLLKGMPELELVEMGERLFTERPGDGDLSRVARPGAGAPEEGTHRRGGVVGAALPDRSDRPRARASSTSCARAWRSTADGAITGEVVHPSCYGVGKAIAARDFAAAHGIELSRSFFYTDSDEDLPLLDIVGRPRPINPTRTLSAIAAKRGWPARRFTSRGTPPPQEVVRTALAAASAVPSFLLSVPAALLTGDWQQGLNLALSTWGELGTAIAGVDLQVQGEQYLWSHRPAVFIFNHQSAVETLLLCKLLRRDFVGIAKKELQRIGDFGPFFAAGGTIFVDRFNHEQAVHALEPAIEALRRGISIVIAPEGTRSPTPRLGRLQEGRLSPRHGRQAPDRADRLQEHASTCCPSTASSCARRPSRWSCTSRSRRPTGRDGTSTGTSTRCTLVREDAGREKGVTVTGGRRSVGAG